MALSWDMTSAALRAPLRLPETLRVDMTVALGATHVQALRARDISAKEACTLVDEQGRFFRASVTRLDARSGEALVYEAMSGSTESPVELTLLCAVLGRQRMLTIIQKATELGVARVIPVLSERSVPASGLAHEKAHAWPKQATRAARQCRRASLPEIREATGLRSALTDPAFAGAALRVYLDDRAASSSALPPLPAAGPSPHSVAFAVGPEGGWSDAERTLLTEQGATGLRIGGRVLRAETAALVGLTLLQQAYGDF